MRRTIWIVASVVIVAVVVAVGYTANTINTGADPWGVFGSLDTLMAKSGGCCPFSAAATTVASDSGGCCSAGETTATAVALESGGCCFKDQSAAAKLTSDSGGGCAGTTCSAAALATAACCESSGCGENVATTEVEFPGGCEGSCSAVDSTLAKASDAQEVEEGEESVLVAGQ